MMNGPLCLLDKVYSDESLLDLDDDVYDALQDAGDKIPVHECGIRKGRFTVQIFWEDDS